MANLLGIHLINSMWSIFFLKQACKRGKSEAKKCEKFTGATLSELHWSLPNIFLNTLTGCRAESARQPAFAVEPLCLNCIEALRNFFFTIWLAAGQSLPGSQTFLTFSGQPGTSIIRPDSCQNRKCSKGLFFYNFWIN